MVEPLIPAIVTGIHQAFSIATSATFAVGIVTTLIATVVVLVIMPVRLGEGATEADQPIGPVTEPSAEPEPVTVEAGDGRPGR